jgi:uncharacterized protein with ParB-like and HNH nuclease domain
VPYQEETIKTIVDRLNTQYFLPAIQREFVWKPQQVILLFDSIMRGYPISSFLFWELSPDNRDKWEIYEFADEAHSDGTHHRKCNAPYGIGHLTLVLDGQQRLTSMLIGLKGAYRIRKPRMWAAISSNSPANVLYLDLFEDPAPRDDDQEFAGKPYYGFAFKPKDEPINSADHYWFRVGRILDCHNEEAFYDLRDAEEAKFPEGVTKAKENLFERNLARLYNAVWKDAAISYFVERDQDYDRVLDIFVRANEAGTELTKAQILLSMLTSKWSSHKAKDEIEGLIYLLNEKLPRRNSLGLEFIMRCCLVLTGLPVRYRINNFTNSAIAAIEASWPAIRSTIEKTVLLANSFGLDRDNLTSANALIPLAYYVHQHPKITFLGDSALEVRNARFMRQWLFMVLLNNVFGRASEQVLANTRRVLVALDPGSDFPYSALNTELARMNYAVGLVPEVEERWLKTAYPRAFLPLSLLYRDHLWGVTPHERDHIFPKAMFSADSPAFQQLSPEKQQRFKELSDRLGNLELLEDDENRKKQAKPFAEWINSRDESFQKRHFIPADRKLYELEHFEDFISARETLLRGRFKEVLALTGF